MQQAGGALDVALIGILFGTVLIHDRVAGAAEAEAYACAFAAASGYAGLMGLVILALFLSLKSGCRLGHVQAALMMLVGLLALPEPPLRGALARSFTRLTPPRP